MKEGSGQLRERGSRNSLAGHSDKAVVTGVVAWNAMAKKEAGTRQNHPSCGWAGKGYGGHSADAGAVAVAVAESAAITSIPTHVEPPCGASQVAGTLSLERSLLHQNM